jgi:hypothetical protein
MRQEPRGGRPARALKVLVDNFNLMPISTAEEDLKAILG